jgi:hypothetical protein
MAWHGMAWHGMAWHGTARHGTARHGTARHGMEWNGMTATFFEFELDLSVAGVDISDWLYCAHS